MEKNLQRIADGILPEDRQDAVAELRDLLMHNSEVRLLTPATMRAPHHTCMPDHPAAMRSPAQAQLALGNGGFPVLMHALREERGDVELVRGVLECLVIALQPSERAHRVRLSQPPCQMKLSRTSRHAGSVRWHSLHQWRPPQHAHLIWLPADPCG